MIFSKKIEKNNNAGNEFLGINTHENINFRKKIFFASCRGVAIFQSCQKKVSQLDLKRQG